jgi:hypothetical protein
VMKVMKVTKVLWSRSCIAGSNLHHLHHFITFITWVRPRLRHLSVDCDLFANQNDHEHQDHLIHVTHRRNAHSPSRQRQIRVDSQIIAFLI